MPKKPSYLADFDSGAGMLLALSRFLHGNDFPLLGTLPRWTAPGMKVLAATVNHLPRWWQEQVYIWSGWLEAIAPDKVAEIDGHAIAAWMASLYPTRKYPAVAVGSANGAAMHLWAALGIPWLPQTYLVPVARSGIHPDEPGQDMEWGRGLASQVLQRNPDLTLHHMHDPVQDRLMVQQMTYFRFKRLTLGPAYEAFLQRALEPGGTVFIMECNLAWPVTACGERDVFQFGAVGGATIDELQHGGARVSAYLERYGSHRRSWDPPRPTGSSPEAEWGFQPQFGEDVARLARRHGWNVRRIVFEQPEDLSPQVADLYAWWNRRRRIAERRLLVESFILMEPYWALRTGSIPFWMVFNTEGSLRSINAYLDGRAAFDEIFMMLFSHGVDSVGLPTIAQWRRVLGRARTQGRFLGVDERAFPRDFAVFVRYYYDLRRRIRATYPLPPPLTLKELDEFLKEDGPRGAVQWLNGGS
jgi:hypothetical protein